MSVPEDDILIVVIFKDGTHVSQHFSVALQALAFYKSNKENPNTADIVISQGPERITLQDVKDLAVEQLRESTSDLLRGKLEIL